MNRCSSAVGTCTGTKAGACDDRDESRDGDDSRYFRVEVRPFAGYWECRTYTLTVDMHD